MAEERATTTIHQIVVEGRIIYEGADWVQAFLEAGRHPAYRHKAILHLYNGNPGARWLPVLVDEYTQRDESNV
jgi:hypothetical protein